MVHIKFIEIETYLSQLQIELLRSIKLQLKPKKVSGVNLNIIQFKGTNII